MRIAVCDDSMMERGRIVGALCACDPVARPESFESGEALLKAAAEEIPFDLVFLDIYMPDKNGVEVAGRLRAISPSTEIAFVTTSVDYAVEAFALNAIHYLVKPVKAADVEETLRRLAHLRRKKRAVSVFADGSGSYTLYLDEISYIRSDGHAKEIVMTNGRIYRIRMSMEEMEGTLGDGFLRVNRSYIVNMEQIEHIYGSVCNLKDGNSLEISRRERGRIREAYDSYLFSRLSERKGLEAQLGHWDFICGILLDFSSSWGRGWFSASCPLMRNCFAAREGGHLPDALRWHFAHLRSFP